MVYGTTNNNVKHIIHSFPSYQPTLCPLSGCTQHTCANGDLTESRVTHSYTKRLVTNCCHSVRWIVDMHLTSSYYRRYPSGRISLFCENHGFCLICLHIFGIPIFNFLIFENNDVTISNCESVRCDCCSSSEITHTNDGCTWQHGETVCCHSVMLEQCGVWLALCIPTHHHPPLISPYTHSSAS